MVVGLNVFQCEVFGLHLKAERFLTAMQGQLLSVLNYDGNILPLTHTLRPDKIITQPDQMQTALTKTTDNSRK